MSTEAWLRQCIRTRRGETLETNIPSLNFWVLLLIFAVRVSGQYWLSSVSHIFLICWKSFRMCVCVCFLKLHGTSFTCYGRSHCCSISQTLHPTVMILPLKTVPIVPIVYFHWCSFISSLPWTLGGKTCVKFKYTHAILSF